MNHQTRESWLEEAVELLQPVMKKASSIFLNTEFPRVRVSVGWPSKGGTSKKSQVIGQCWRTTVATDEVSQIFISPTLGEDGIRMLGVLVHEMIHAWDDVQSGHKGPFIKAARLVGLEGKPSATVVNPDSELGRTLASVLNRLGDFPHAALNVEEMEKQEPKQTTRMLKLVAPDCCEYVVRTTRKHIDIGFPSCPHGTEMELAD
jgi:hypothetical protein